MRETPLNNWGHFFSKITATCGTDDFQKNFLFRGQRDQKWKLETSFDRHQAGTLTEREKFFDHAMENFADRIESSVISSIGKDQIAGLAQHYGMPTRILDWSYSPYVAMFFACAGALEHGSRPALFVLNVPELEKVVSLKSELSIVDYRPEHNERLKNQRGCFTRLMVDFTNIDDFFTSKNVPSNVLTKIKVSSAVVRPALRQLSSMDISYERLFPGLEGIAKQSWLEHLARS